MLLHAALVSLRVSPLRKLRNQRFQVPPCSWLYVSQLPFGETGGYLVSPISRGRIPPFRSATNKPGRLLDTAENMSSFPGKNDILSTLSPGGVIGLSMSSDRSKARIQMRARPWVLAEEREPSPIERCDRRFGLTNGSSSLRHRDDCRFVSSLFYPSVTIRSGDTELIVVSCVSNFCGVDSFDCDMVAIVPHRH